MDLNFQITLCGGSNLCHSSIACIGHHNPNIKINVLTRKPELFSDKIVAYTEKSSWAHKGNMTGKINKVSSNPKDVIPGSKIIIICTPAHVKIQILAAIKDYIEKDALVGSIFGQGGFDLQAKFTLGDDMKTKNLTLFCLQYVPFISKAITYGKEAIIIGPKTHLYVVAYPPEKVHYAANQMTLLYTIPSKIVPNFMNLTLCPSNQIIHTGRMVGFFKEWDGKSSFNPKEIPLLYEGIDDDSAEQIQLLDNEIQLIKTAIVKEYPQLNLDTVIPIKERIINMYYDQISDKSTLQKVFATNIGYSRVTFPMVPAENGRVTPNLNARFFWEDIPYGLCILKNYGEVFGVATPNIDRNIQWHQKFMPIKFVDETNKFIKESLSETGCPYRYGMETKRSLVDTSLTGNNAKL